MAGCDATIQNSASRVRLTDCALDLGHRSQTVLGTACTPEQRAGAVRGQRRVSVLADARLEEKYAQKIERDADQRDFAARERCCTCHAPQPPGSQRLQDSGKALREACRAVTCPAGSGTLTDRASSSASHRRWPCCTGKSRSRGGPTCDCVIVCTSASGPQRTWLNATCMTRNAWLALWRLRRAV